MISRFDMITQSERAESLLSNIATSAMDLEAGIVDIILVGDRTGLSNLGRLLTTNYRVVRGSRTIDSLDSFVVGPITFYFTDMIITQDAKKES